MVKCKKEETQVLRNNTSQISLCVMDAVESLELV